MTTFHGEKELQRLKKLAAEYQRQGYETHLFPKPDQLPQALKGLAIALIGYRESRAMVVADVRTRDTLTLGGNASLRVLTERVELLHAEVHLVVIGTGREKDV